MPTVPDIHRRGTRAAQATIAAPPLTVGTLYFVTDEGVTERWDGTTWEAYSGAGGGGGVPAAHAASHQSGGSDPLALDTLAAPTDIATLNASAGAHGLLRKLSGVPTQYLDGNGTWSTPAGGGGFPAAHKLSHQDGGADEISVTGLSGLLADGQTPLAHKTSHENGGADEISVLGLSGLLADGQTPLAHATSHNTGGSDPITALSGAVITTGTVAAARLPTRTGAIGLILDGGGSVLTTGIKGFVEVPFACTITAATLLSSDAAVTSGSVVVDVWKDVYANYPPTVADTITASAKPTLSSATKSKDTTLTGWTTSIAAGDVIGFKVDSVALLTRVTLTLTVQAV